MLSQSIKQYFFLSTQTVITQYCVGYRRTPQQQQTVSNISTPFAKHIRIFSLSFTGANKRNSICLTQFTQFV